MDGALFFDIILSPPTYRFQGVYTHIRICYSTVRQVGGTVSYGRRKIYSDAKEITATNVKDEVSKALAVHNINRSEIDAL